MDCAFNLSTRESGQSNSQKGRVCVKTILLSIVYSVTSPSISSSPQRKEAKPTNASLKRWATLEGTQSKSLDLLGDLHGWCELEQSPGRPSSYHQQQDYLHTINAWSNCPSVRPYNGQVKIRSHKILPPRMTNSCSFDYSGGLMPRNS